MGRPRGFDESAVVAAAASQFLTTGYEGTSIDDLVSVSGLHRGSLYKAFGSKHGIFLAALRHVVNEELPVVAVDPTKIVHGSTLDMVLVAALELAPRDEEVRELVDRACALLADGNGETEGAEPAALLGRRLLHRAGATTNQPDCTE